ASDWSSDVCSSDLRWLPDLSKARARCGISRPRQYFQRNHSVFLNSQRVSRDLIVHSNPPTGYGAIAGTIGSRNNSPETGTFLTMIRLENMRSCPRRG